MKAIRYTEITGLSSESKKLLREYAEKYGVEYVHDLCPLLASDSIFTQPSSLRDEIVLKFNEYGYSLLTPKPREFYLSEAALYLDISVAKLREMIKKKQVSFIKTGTGGVRFLKEDLDRVKK